MTGREGSSRDWDGVMVTKDTMRCCTSHNPPELISLDKYTTRLTIKLVSVILFPPLWRLFFPFPHQGCVFYWVVLWNPSTFLTTSQVSVGERERHVTITTESKQDGSDFWVWGGRGRGGGSVGGRGLACLPALRKPFTVKCYFFVCLSFNSKAFLTNQCCYTTGTVDRELHPSANAAAPCCISCYLHNFILCVPAELRNLLILPKD